MNKRLDKLMNLRIYNWMNKGKNKWVNRQMNKWMDVYLSEWISERMVWKNEYYYITRTEKVKSFRKIYVCHPSNHDMINDWTTERR